MFRKLRRALGLDKLKIGLGFLTWNTKSVSLRCIDALLAEAERLRLKGHEVLVVICDNGSLDGTQEALRDLDTTISIPHRFLLNETNRGNSIGRNQFIDAMLDWGADYLFFNDGDIEIVPRSVHAMLQYLDAAKKCVAAVGPYSFGFTKERAEMSPTLKRIDRALIENNCSLAPTHYGLFRRELFERGVRFEESHPFDGPGWGFEDNDFAFQILAMGYKIHQFKGMTYWHPHMRSSVDQLRASGIEPRELCERRKQYVIDKWQGTPIIDEGPLDLIRASSTNI